MSQPRPRSRPSSCDLPRLLHVVEIDASLIGQQTGMGVHTARRSLTAAEQLHCCCGRGYPIFSSSIFLVPIVSALLCASNLLPGIMLP